MDVSKQIVVLYFWSVYVLLTESFCSWFKISEEAGPNTPQKCLSHVCLGNKTITDDQPKGNDADMHSV